MCANQPGGDCGTFAGVGDKLIGDARQEAQNSVKYLGLVEKEWQGRGVLISLGLEGQYDFNSQPSQDAYIQTVTDRLGKLVEQIDQKPEDTPLLARLQLGYAYKRLLAASESIQAASAIAAFKSSSGIIVKANPEKVTTVLGSYDKDMKNFIQQFNVEKSADVTKTGTKGGFNVLNAPDELYKNSDQFWEQFNKPFLDAAIKRGDDIVIATKFEKDVLIKDGLLTGFGREMKYLKENGYLYNEKTGKMVKN